MAEVLDEKTRVEDLLFIAGHLIKLLEQENAALSHNRIDKVKELLEQKSSSATHMKFALLVWSALIRT